MHEFNPYSVSLGFFSEVVLILRSPLHPKNGTPVTQIWPNKSANHGAQRKWPLASSMSRRHPNPAHQPHPHTMANMPMVGLGVAYVWGE
jgi:hypothetical protein